MLQVVWVARAGRQRLCGAQDPQGELEGRGVSEGPHYAAQGQDCGVPGWHLHPGHGHEGGQGQLPPPHPPPPQLPYQCSSDMLARKSCHLFT